MSDANNRENVKKIQIFKILMFREMKAINFASFKGAYRYTVNNIKTSQKGIATVVIYMHLI